jgi:hypothetical protein
MIIGSFSDGTQFKLNAFFLTGIIDVPLDLAVDEP